MLWCARRWLRHRGACREEYASHDLPDKCRGCPLYDPGWAAESVRPGTAPVFPADPGWGEGEPLVIEVPDYPPEDWT